MTLKIFTEAIRNPQSVIRNPMLAGLLAVLALACMALFFPARTLAHPVALGAIEVVIHPDRITLQAKVSVEEVCVSNALRVNDQQVYGAQQLLAAYGRHGEYLLKHLRLHADGRELSGRVVKIAPPGGGAADLDPLEVQKNFAVYRFEYALPAGGAAPQEIQLEQNVLKEFVYAPGNPWEAAYVARFALSTRKTFEMSLLKGGVPLRFDCAKHQFASGAAPADALPADPSQPSAAALFDDPQTSPLPPAVDPQPERATRIDVWRTGWEYLAHGVHHILTGYDHLLFISALTLATLTLWDLVKVVSAFTLAHSLTLTLAVLGWVRLPERIVEPMIAASIVFVAVENIFWPQRTRGWGRLAAAFGFGLFHGLGFAGGLMDAMQGMPVMGLALAIVSFSLGVEIGHQIVVLPLFGGLTLGRRQIDAEKPEAPFSRLTLRYGSIMISVAGLFYLVTAIWNSEF